MTTKTNELSTANVEQIPIASITVGARRRKKVTRVKQMAKSIDTLGVIHPIVVRNGNELVCGARRLAACQLLNWKTIPARRLETLTDKELRALELEENTQRVSLLDHEAATERLQEIEAVRKKVLEQGSKTKSSRGGRPKTAAQKAVQEATGLTNTQVQRVERHVALADEYPMFKQSGWVEHTVLAAGDALESLPKSARSHAAQMLDTPGIEPKKVPGYLRNLKEMPAPVRRKVFKLAQSSNEHDQQRALSAVARLPSPPDPALNLLRKAETDLLRAKEVLKAAAFQKRVDAVSDQVSKIVEALTLHVRKEREHLWLQ